MKYLVFLLGLFMCINAKAQFPGGTDTLRRFNNRFIDNDAKKAFTNLRLHNLLAGIIDQIDTAAGGGSIALGLDTLWAQDDSTLIYRKNGLFYTVIVRGATGAGPIYRVPFSNGVHLTNDSNFLFDKSQGANAAQLIVGPTTISSGGLAKINATSDNMNALGLTSYGTGLNTILFRRARGSIASPTGLLNDDDLFNLSGRGYTGSLWTTSRAGIFGRVSQNWTDTTNGTRLYFATTSNDSTNMYTRVILDDSLQVSPVIAAASDSIMGARRNANGLVTMTMVPNTGGSSGGGITYIYSATAPTGTDTAKIWIKTPDVAGVYDVLTYVSNQLQYPWQRFGWLSIDGVFSTLRPYNILMMGQSNAAGVGDGGDTSYVPGIIAWGNTSGNGASSDYEDEWHQARINKSPFYSSHNNIAFQTAKQIIKHGVARIVRIITTYEGGTSLDSWIDGSNGHYLLDTLRSRLTRSGIDSIDIACWHQGESGGVSSFTVGGYVKDIRVFLDSMYSPLTKGFYRNYTKFVGGGPADTTYYYTPTNAGAPFKAQEGFDYDGNLFTGFASSKALYNIGDNTHFTGGAIDTLGFRYFAAAQSLPHTTYQEEPPYTTDSTYDLFMSYETLTTGYSGGGNASFKKIGAGFGWKTNALNRLFTIQNTGILVGEALGFAGEKMFSVNGKAQIVDGAYNTVLGAGWYTNSNPEHNAIFAVYPSNFDAGGASESIHIGYNAGYNTTRMLFNSTIIGSGAALNITPLGFGDRVTAVGKGSLASGACLSCAFFGNDAGASAQGNNISGFGPDAGALNSTARTNSTAIGANAKYNADSTFVVGSTLRSFEIGGLTTPYKFKVDATPSSGQQFLWNSTNSQFELSSSANENFFNTDLRQTANRSHSAGNFTLLYDSIKTLNLSGRGLNFQGKKRFCNFFMDATNSEDLNDFMYVRHLWRKAADDGDSARQHLVFNGNTGLKLESANDIFAKSSKLILQYNVATLAGGDYLQIMGTPAAANDSIFSVGSYDAATKTNVVNKIPVNSSSLPHTLNKKLTSTDNTSTTETDLYSYTVPANKLLNNGNSMSFDINGTFNDATSTADLQFYFAGTSFANTGALTVSVTSGWSARGSVQRLTSTTALATVTVITPGATLTSFVTYLDLTGLDFTTTNIFKVTGQAGGAGGGTGDITLKPSAIMFWP